jgi:hypothetical protein
MNKNHDSRQVNAGRAALVELGLILLALATFPLW